MALPQKGRSTSHQNAGLATDTLTTLHRIWAKPNNLAF
jgi:hypothetical protein